MLLVLTCSCHDIEPMVRNILKKSGDKSWLSRPIYRGKTAAGKALKRVTGVGRNRDLVFVVAGYVTKKSRYAIFIGFDADHFEWVDFSSGSAKLKLDAEILASRYQ